MKVSLSPEEVEALVRWTGETKHYALDRFVELLKSEGVQIDPGTIKMFIRRILAKESK